jgi:hypothetical protein
MNAFVALVPVEKTAAYIHAMYGTDLMSEICDQTENKL